MTSSKSIAHYDDLKSNSREGWLIFSIHASYFYPQAEPEQLKMCTYIHWVFVTWKKQEKCKLAPVLCLISWWQCRHRHYNCRRELNASLLHQPFIAFSLSPLSSFHLCSSPSEPPPQQTPIHILQLLGRCQWVCERGREGLLVKEVSSHKSRLMSITPFRLHSAPRTRAHSPVALLIRGPQDARAYSHTHSCFDRWTVNHWSCYTDATISTNM